MIDRAFNSLIPDFDVGLLYSKGSLRLVPTYCTKKQIIRFEQSTTDDQSSMKAEGQSQQEEELDLLSQADTLSLGTIYFSRSILGPNQMGNSHNCS